MLNQLGEDGVKPILSNFVCPLNKDVEDFIRYKAIEFAKQSIAPTHLVFSSFKSEPVLIGYFTLAVKVLSVSKHSLSSNLRKRIAKFGRYEENISGYIIPAPLIAQLSKNYQNGYNQLITGDELLKLACDAVSKVQQVIGGKIVYLECEDKDQLLNFYSANGFVNFGKRILDKDETSTLSGEYLIQMLKYLK
jgi:hypothetical protein